MGSQTKGGTSGVGWDYATSGQGSGGFFGWLPHFDFLAQVAVAYIERDVGCVLVRATCVCWRSDLS